VRLQLKRQEIWENVPKQGYGEYWGVERLLDCISAVDCNMFLQIFGQARHTYFAELSALSLSVGKGLLYQDPICHKELKFSIDEELLEYYESLESSLLV
jgi:hypothetical protein